MLHLHAQETIKGDLLYLVQRRQKRGEIIKLVEADF